MKTPNQEFRHFCDIATDSQLAVMQTEEHLPERLQYIQLCRAGFAIKRMYPVWEGEYSFNQ